MVLQFKRPHQRLQSLCWLDRIVEEFAVAEAS